MQVRFTRTINDYAKKNGHIKDTDETFTGDDVREGLTVVISIKMPEIQFEGQTKAKLGSVEARGATETVFSPAFSSFLEEHPDDAKFIIAKVFRKSTTQCKKNWLHIGR